MSAEQSPDRLARAGLSRVVEPGDPAARESFGDGPPAEIWARMRDGGPGLADWLPRAELADPERDLDRAAKLGARFVIPGDDEWPEQLDVLAVAGTINRRGGPPYGLWVRGEHHLRQALARSVAVVGARACSSYGQHVGGEFGAGLADHGVTVVSGGAYGVDAAAHRGALAEEGLTVAILAGGVDSIYPKGHTALFQRIAADGLLVSELPPGCSPTRLRFLARNRLIAAGTQGTVVAEAAARSGSLNTANWAGQCGRPVLAVPGSIASTMSDGAHALIREKGAILVTDVDDILEAVSPIGQHLTSPRRGPERATDRLDETAERVLDAVPVSRPIPAERIAVTAGLSRATTEASLHALRQAGLVDRLDAGWQLSEQFRVSDRSRSPSAPRDPTSPAPRC